MPELNKPSALLMPDESGQAVVETAGLHAGNKAGTIRRPAQGKSGPFAGKVAIVTGSESGIGKATARALCEAGAFVVLNGRTPDRLAQTEREFLAGELPVVSCLADVTVYADCERLIDTAIEAFGQLDILITNASISMRAYFADMQPDVFREVFDSNVYGSSLPP